MYNESEKSGIERFCSQSWWDQAHRYSNSLPLSPYLLEVTPHIRIYSLSQNKHLMHNPKPFKLHFFYFLHLIYRSDDQFSLGVCSWELDLKDPPPSASTEWSLKSIKAPSQGFVLKTWTLNNFHIPTTKLTSEVFCHGLINEILFLDFFLAMPLKV